MPGPHGSQTRRVAQVTRSLRVRRGWAQSPARPLPGSVTLGKWPQPFGIPVCKFTVRPWRPPPGAAGSLKWQRLSERPGVGPVTRRRGRSG